MPILTLFAIVAVAEMATFLWVESRIGLGPALFLAVATALVGSFLVRRAGISVLGRIRMKLHQRRLPGRELGDGAAILVAGAFLISPGFITDVCGFLLLVPAVRDLLFRTVSKRVSGGMTVFVSGEAPTPPEQHSPRGPAPDTVEDVIDVDADLDELPD